MTPTRFRELHTGFRTTPDDLVQTKIDKAVERVSEKAFGKCYEEALGYMVAHLIVTDPFGRTQRQDDGGEPDKYIVLFNELRDEVIPKVLVVI